MSAEFDRWTDPERRREPIALPAFTPRLVLGFGILIFGALLLLDNLDLIEASHLIRYLVPSVLLGIGLSVLSRKSGWGWLWVAAGSWILLDALDVIDLDFWEVFFPLALVAVGFVLVTRGARGPLPPARTAAEKETRTHAFAFMSGNVRKNDSDTFRGGDLGAFMGGVELDLRQAKTIEDGAVIDAFAMWGGIEIRVPEGWRVVSEVVPLLGGFEDNTKPPADPAAVQGRLVVRGVVVMGGIEVKN
jgi:hypothetical protein